MPYQFPSEYQPYIEAARRRLRTGKEEAEAGYTGALRRRGLAQSGVMAEGLADIAGSFGEAEADIVARVAAGAGEREFIAGEAERGRVDIRRREAVARAWRTSQEEKGWREKEKLLRWQVGQQMEMAEAMQPEWWETLAPVAGDIAASMIWAKGGKRPAASYG